MSRLLYGYAANDYRRWRWQVFRQLYVAGVAVAL